MKWNVLSTLERTQKKTYIHDILAILLHNRGIVSKKEQESFLHPTCDTLKPEDLHIDLDQLRKASDRIRRAITNRETIVIYGDYDVDGVTGTAILWEALHENGANVHPYIPHRVEEGYGLSIAGITNLTAQEKLGQCSLIITVDNGTVASEAVDFAKERGIDVIITDHHELPETLPHAYAIVHTTDICGAGVGWVLAETIVKKGIHAYLDLLTLSTVADLMPLTGANRAIVAHGLPELRKTKRIGLQQLFLEAGLEDASVIGVYEIGHIIAPRLNAMGRLESAMDSLRLLCTQNPHRARDLAHLLGETNRGRQLLMQAAALQAVEEVKRVGTKQKIIVHVGDYEEGIIGLVAGKLVETFYRPAIVIARKGGVSKASARSVQGFDIITFIRKHQEFLINAGGHPMAAGFSLAPDQINGLKQAMEVQAEEEIFETLLEKELRIDCQLPFEFITQDFFSTIQQLSPFGTGNPEPTFASTVHIQDLLIIGKDKNHIKMHVGDGPKNIEAIGFGMAERSHHLTSGDTINIAYTIHENIWNGKKNIQLIIKDIVASPSKP